MRFGSPTLLVTVGGMRWAASATSSYSPLDAASSGRFTANRLSTRSSSFFRRLAQVAGGSVGQNVVGLAYRVIEDAVDICLALEQTVQAKAGGNERAVGLHHFVP